MKNNFNVLLLNAINLLHKEKQIDKEIIRDFLLESIKRAFIKSNYEDNIEISLDLETGDLISNKIYQVVEDNDDFDEYIHILNTDKRVIDNNLSLGDIYKEPIDISKEFKQQQVQQILQSFKQKITEISNQRVYKSWQKMINEVVIAEIEKEDKKGNFFTINLADKIDKDGNSLESTLGFLGKKELNPLEKLDVSKKYHFVVVSIKEQSKFCPVILSRASEKLVEYYMNMEIPEIDDGSIEIVKSARIAGIKTKVIVKPKISLPISAASICIGPKGNRVKTISKLLSGEKIEIVNYSDNLYIQILNLFDKSKIIGIDVDEQEKEIILVTDEESVLTLIGRNGTNVKLASMLCNYSISIMSESDAKQLGINYININSKEFDNLTKLDSNIDNIDDLNNVNIMNLNDNEIDEIINDDINLLDIDNSNIDEFNDAFKDELTKILKK